MKSCAQKPVLAQNPDRPGLSESFRIRLPKSPRGRASKSMILGMCSIME